MRSWLAHLRAKSRARIQERRLKTPGELDRGLQNHPRKGIQSIHSGPLRYLGFHSLCSVPSGHIYSTEHHKSDMPAVPCMPYRLHSLSLQPCFTQVYATLTAVLYKWFQLMYRYCISEQTHFVHLRVTRLDRDGCILGRLCKICTDGCFILLLQDISHIHVKKSALLNTTEPKISSD